MSDPSQSTQAPPDRTDTPADPELAAGARDPERADAAAQSAVAGPESTPGPSASAPETPDASDAPAKRRRRRRRSKKRSAEPNPSGMASVGPEPSATPQPAAGAPADPALANLAAGLFSHLDDREVPCRVEGCPNTWVWPSHEQIVAYGQPPPRRMCASCQRADAELADAQVQCSTEGCKRTWTWTRDAQAKHRMWAQRGHKSSSRSGRGRRRGKSERSDGPPQRMCDLCHAKLSRLGEREVVCKVHSCTRMAKVDRESQLRAWALLSTDDLTVDAPLPKRMCEACRDFCRNHGDRAAPCGRPGCDRTWTYKTGAQLQAFLAGRFDDPLRLCEECLAGGFESVPGVEDGVEVMPCIVLACTGTWPYRPGTAVAAYSPDEAGDLPLDRMCEGCRRERGDVRGDAEQSTTQADKAEAQAPAGSHEVVETATESSPSADAPSPELSSSS